MGSSGSTPNPRPSAPLRRWIRVIGDDHPRACTGRRLLSLGLVRAYSGDARAGAPVVLDPYADRPLSGADRPRAERVGVLVIDCSWNRLSARAALPIRDGGALARRRLPFLIATNPQHYGRFGELNTAEALGAAIYLLGRPTEAAELLHGFAGGPAFFEVNRTRLDAFRSAGTAEAARELERALYAEPAPTPAPRRPAAR